MKEIGVNTVILQWSEYGDIVFVPGKSNENGDQNDMIENILSVADAQDMQVVLGLSFHEDWWKRWQHKSFREDSIERNIDLAKTLLRKYGEKHKSISGWYIPFELWDRDYLPHEIERLNLFLAAISKGVKAVKPMPVMVSSFFGQLTTPDVVEKNFSEILLNSGIDVLLPQDGVGERARYRSNIGVNVVPYLMAFKAACEKLSIKFMPVIEVFELNEKGEREPAKVETIKAQLESYEDFSSDQDVSASFGMFDFFHYMSPNRSPRHEKLYRDYKKMILTQPVL